MILSAAGESNGTGLVISGMVGRFLASSGAAREFKASRPNEFEMAIQEIANNKTIDKSKRVMTIFGGF